MIADQQNKNISQLVSFSIGFTLGILLAIAPVYFLFCRNIERDAFGVILSVVTLIVALGIALIQITLALVSRQESSKSFQNIERNLYRPLPGTFEKVFENIHQVILYAADNSEMCLDIGWPIHNIGNIHTKTRENKLHNGIQESLINMVSNDRKISLCTLPLIQNQNATTPSPIFNFLNCSASAKISGHSADASENLKDELTFLIRLLEAIELGKGYQINGKSPLKLIWAERAPIHWSYSTRGEYFEQGLLFTSLPSQNRWHLRSQNKPHTYSAGMLIQANAAPLLMRVAESFKGHNSIHVFDTVEPRLLKMLLKYAKARLDEGIMPTEVLNGLSSCMYSADRLVYWKYKNLEGISSQRAAYVWRKSKSNNVILIIPSAAGLYSLWRDNENTLPKVRFGRYLKFCKSLSKICDCNVVLLSQGGQGGYGCWSPIRSADEFTQALKSIGSILNNSIENEKSQTTQQSQDFNIAAIGICTGGLAAMSAFVDSVNCNTINQKIKGVAFWDVVDNPGFKKKYIESVRKNYNLVLGEDSEFFDDQVKLGARLASDCVDSYKADGVKRFWVGGVEESLRFSAASTRKTHAWAGVKEIGEILGSACTIEGFGDLGHVPGGPNKDEFEKLLWSLKGWTHTVFTSSIPTPKSKTGSPSTATNTQPSAQQVKS